MRSIIVPRIRNHQRKHPHIGWATLAAGPLTRARFLVGSELLAQLDDALT